MQSLSAKGLQGRPSLWAEATGFGPEAGPVGRVPKNGVPDMRQVHADLVGTPRFEGAGEEAGQGLPVRTGKTLQYLPMSDRRPAVPTHGLLVARMGVASDWGIDRTFWTIGCTPDEGEIPALERTVGLFGELL